MKQNWIFDYVSQSTSSLIEYPYQRIQSNLLFVKTNKQKPTITY